MNAVQALRTQASLKHFSTSGRPPVVFAALVTQCLGPESKRAAMLAEIGALVGLSSAQGSSAPCIGIGVV